MDADNISKPTWDALNTLAYADDSQIKIRSAAAFNVSGTDFTFDDSNLTNLLYDIFNSIVEGKDIVYIEVGVIKSNKNLFNLSDIWK